MDEFRDIASGLDAQSLSLALGVPRDIIDSFGLDDLTSIFTNPPPGIDEIVALTKIFKYSRETDGSGRPRFDKIIVDTAPTGHTLRLLQLPVFLGNLTGQLIKFRGKIQGAINSFKSMFSGGSENAEEDKIGGILGRLEELQDNMSALKSTLTDESMTQFLVVTIPTSLAVAESERLMKSLQESGIKVAGVLCNQVVAEDAGVKFLNARRAGQQLSMTTLQGAALADNLEITEVPYVDTEVTGVYGLRYFADLAHPIVDAEMATNPAGSRKLTIFGGKGGVGKTTTAASWGVRLSDSGKKTLVVSTDPAHSLGDALGTRLTGQPVQLDSAANGSGGELWALEVDTVEALDEFRDTIRSTLDDGSTAGSGGGGGGGGFGASFGLPDLKAELSQMLSSDGLADSPGADEVVALTKVVSYLQDGIVQPNGNLLKFDRVVLDTAPTGHTLRMLNLPEFLIQFVGKVKTIRDKAGALGGGGGGGDDGGELAPPEDKLSKFQNKMRELQRLLHDSQETEFCVVTIPTEVAVAETARLVDALEQEDVYVRRLIVNQMITAANADGKDETAKAYLDRLRAGQQRSLTDLNRIAASAGVEVVQVPYFDNELRTVFGLRMIEFSLFGGGGRA
jgi:arsenite-transporting ATPase